MPLRYWIRIVELIFVAALALALFDSWRADRRDRAQLAAELAATKQLVAAADAQHDRDSQLAETLKSLAAEKRTVVTPAQIASQLPREIGLPSPILLQSTPAHLSDGAPTQSNRSAFGKERPRAAPNPRRRKPSSPPKI
jgi:hypothetical protein